MTSRSKKAYLTIHPRRSCLVQDLNVLGAGCRERFNGQDEGENMELPLIAHEDLHGKVVYKVKL